ncbi:MAG: hypothetical protein ACK5B6_05325 [Bacteroidia bacterium]|jgi:hypothetical protein
MRKIFLQLLFLFVALKSSSQVNVKDSLLRVPMLVPSVGLGIPTQDFAQRFGAFTQIGLDFLWKTPKGWLGGVDYQFLFGSQVKETDMLNGILTKDKFLIGADGTLYDVRFQLRGMRGMIKVGRQWPIWGPNKNSGVFGTVGIGFLQHKIRLEFERNADVPQLNEIYSKGYDRLSNGLALSPAVGYFFLGNKRRVNFFMSIEYVLGFTQNRRSYNYDQNAVDLTKRTDGVIGIRAGWIIPLYERKPDEFYFY